MKLSLLISLCALVCFSFAGIAPRGLQAQTRTYPDKIRGYKVERTVVEVKRPTSKPANNGQPAQATSADSNVDQLISLGNPTLARVTPLGITFDVPMVIAPVTQSGKVDFLVFEDIEINGHSVNIADYEHSFSLPNSKPLTLNNPVRIYIYLSSALLAAIGEWTDSQDTWPVKGRVYVFGKFKKSLFSFKRCVPVELDLTMRNPLKEK
jgi:hypothetical protein